MKKEKTMRQAGDHGVWTPSYADLKFTIAQFRTH